MAFDPDIWQQYDCPKSGIDFDIFDGEILAAGERCYCSGCGGYHTAGKDGPNETIVRLAADGEMIFRDLPKDAAEKAAWLEEVAAARLKTPNVELTGAAPLFGAASSPRSGRG